jgi:hypothetical protein
MLIAEEELFMGRSNEVFNKLKELLDKLPQDFAFAREKGLEYIPSIVSPELLIFDVRQPQLRSEKWDELTEREQVEAFAYSLPDYLFRDRIYTRPQYLHIHLRTVTYKSVDEFKAKLTDLAKASIPDIMKVHQEHEFTKPQYDLSEILTRWAAKELHIRDVDPGEKVIVNVPVALWDKSYIFIKLLKDDILEAPYLVLTAETRNFTVCLGATLHIIKFFTTS